MKRGPWRRRQFQWTVGRTRQRMAEQETRKMKIRKIELGASNGGRQRKKNGKTFLSRFPGLEILPSLPLSQAQRRGQWLWVGFACHGARGFGSTTKEVSFERRARLARVVSQKQIFDSYSLYQHSLNSSCELLTSNHELGDTFDNTLAYKMHPRMNKDAKRVERQIYHASSFSRSSGFLSFFSLALSFKACG